MTLTQNVEFPEIGRNDATRIRTTGGTDNIKYYTSAGIPILGQAYTGSVYIKNIGSKPVQFSTSLEGSAVTVNPGEWTRAIASGIGDGIGQFQLRFQALNAGDDLDFIAWGPQAERKPFPTSFVDGTRPDGILAYPIALKDDYTIACYRKSHTDEDYKHVVKLSDGTVYVDGVEDSEYDVGWLGYDGDTLMLSNQTGLVDELLILPYAATDAEIKAWYGMGAPFYDPAGNIVYEGAGGQIEMDKDGIRFIRKADNVETFRVDTETGDAFFKGDITGASGLHVFDNHPGSAAGGAVTINSQGITVTDGKLTVINPQGTVVIDGTSNMLKVAYTGTILVNKTGTGTHYTTWNFPEAMSHRPIGLLYCLGRYPEDPEEAVFMPPTQYEDFGTVFTCLKGATLQLFPDKLKIKIAMDEDFLGKNKWYRFYVFKEAAI